MSKQIYPTRYSEETLFLNETPDYSLFETKLDAVKTVMLVSNDTVYIKDLYKKNYPYIGSQPLFLCGYKENEIAEMGGNIFNHLFTGDDIDFLFDFESALYQFIKNLPIERRDKFVFFAAHRFTHKTGYKLPVNIRISPFLFDSNGNIWMLLARVSFANKKYTRIAYVDMIDTKERFNFDLSTKEFTLIKQQKITKREGAVLVFSARGYTEKEIALEMNLSHNTIKTHKKNLLSKLHANNITEAYIAAMSQKLI